MELSKRKLFFLLIGISGVILIILANFIGPYTTDRVYVVSANFHNTSLSYLASLNMNISLSPKNSMLKLIYEDINKSHINSTSSVDGNSVDINKDSDIHSRGDSLQSTSSNIGDKEILLLNTSNFKERLASFNTLDETEPDRELERVRDVNGLSDVQEFEQDSDDRYSVDELTSKTVPHDKPTQRAEIDKKQENYNDIRDEHVKHDLENNPADVANMLIKSKLYTVEQQNQQQQMHQQQMQQQQLQQHHVLPGQNYQDDTPNIKTHQKERIRPLDFNEQSAHQDQRHRTEELDVAESVNNNIERNKERDDAIIREFDDQKSDTNLEAIKNVRQSSNDVEIVVEDLKDLDSHVNDLRTKDLHTTDVISEAEDVSRGFVKDPNCYSRSTIAEDILCLKRPKFLSDYRNPCWYEGSTLRCLPYFYIFGVCKTGSTDLFERLSHHPEVMKNRGLLGKETWYWGWKRYGHSNFYRSYRELMTFDEYIDNFDAYNIHSITKRLPNGTLYHPAVTGHGDPMDFWDHSSWQMIPQNDPYLDEPNITTPSLVKHVNPNIKLILLLRDPVERLFSNYLHGKFGETAEQFHEDVLTSLSLLSSCRQTRSIKSCLYDGQIIRDLRVPLSASFYSVHLEEWLKVFPRKQIFIIRTEEFSNNVANTLLRLFRFLKLDPIPTRDLYRIANMPHFYDTKAKLTSGEIQSDTREVLETLFDPYNTDLAKMLDDEKFNFNAS